MLEYYNEPAKKIPIRNFDVVIAGGGTGGVVAAIASARTGAKTALIEGKGYTGGIVVEGGTALHSFFNLWKAFPGIEKRQVVKGIPQEIITRLEQVGGTTGHAEMLKGYDYDSVCTAIDTELYKLVSLEMLQGANVHVFLNSFVRGVIMDKSTIQGIIVESRSGREAFYAHSFVDCTGYGDLCAYAGAKFTEPNDYPVANSIGVAGVSIEKYHDFLSKNNALSHYCEGKRSGEMNKIVRLDAKRVKPPLRFLKEGSRIGMHTVITSVHDDYFMFVKLNKKMKNSPTNRDDVSKTEVILRQRMQKAVNLIRKYIPGCEKAFITRTSPSLCIRRGRLIDCDYDISLEDIVNAQRFEDEIMVYGFHDLAPFIQIKDGGVYGIPYRALLVKDIENLYATGMMITKDFKAHMSTRNTVSCMGQGQGAGTAAALCALNELHSRELPYSLLRKHLLKDNVYLGE